MISLYNDKKLFKLTTYADIRRAFAAQFELQHAEAITLAYGDDLEEMTDWLQKNEVIKEELYNAIEPKHDDLVGVLRVFKELKSQFPQKIVPYANLAIATSLTWDRKGRGVYDFAHHARRTKTTVPDGLMEAVANFKYFLDAEKFMQGRAQYVPWEFLVHMVNHKTPEVERKWGTAVDEAIAKALNSG